MGAYRSKFLIRYLEDSMRESKSPLSCFPQSCGTVPEGLERFVWPPGFEHDGRFSLI